MTTTPPSSVYDLAARRRTARVFAKTPVKLEDILYCVRAAVQAPSGANRQPWRFVIVDDPKAREEIRVAWRGTYSSSQ